MLPGFILFMIVEMVRACYWLCFGWCKEREKCCKCRNTKGRKNRFEGENYPCQPPYPNKQETIRMLKEEPRSFYLAISTVEEELSCLEACAICVFG